MTEKKISARSGRNKDLITIEGNPRWVEWVDDFARSMSLSRSALIDQSIRRWYRELYQRQDSAPIDNFIPNRTDGSTNAEAWELREGLKTWKPSKK